MADIPNPARAGLARYLIGLGPMPPPNPQDVALAQLCGALDRGMFKQPWNANLPIQAAQLPAAFPAPERGALPPMAEHQAGQLHQTPPEGQFFFDCDMIRTYY